MQHSRLLYTILFLFSSAAMLVAQYTVPLPNRDVTVNSVNGIASFKGAPVTAEPGQPLLPAYTVTFLLPPDADFSTIKVTLEKPSEKELDGTFDVKPALPPTTSDKIVWLSGRKIVDGKDVDIYNRNEFFPAQFKGTVHFGAMRNYKLAEITVLPYKYNPVTHKLRTITGGTLVLTIPSNGNGATLQQAPLRTAPESDVEEWLKNNIVNPQLLQNYGVQTQKGLSSQSSNATAASGTYAIITTNAISNGSSQLNNLIALKQQKGFNVIKVTENTWGGGTGNTAANNLRNWLRNNYLSQNIRYVLLIGNPDPTLGDVPMKMCWPRLSAIEYRDAPTDFFYAELTGNWDINNDGNFGDYADFSITGGPDRFAEVAVGRIPSYNGDFTSLDKIIQKIIRYENETAVEWRRFALIPIEPSGDVTPGFEVGEKINADFMVPKSVNSYRLYDQFNGYSGAIVDGVMALNPSAESPECSQTKVLNTWKNTSFGLVTWFTHGWSQGASSVFSTSYISYLDDQHPSIVWEGSCENAYPESNTNLAYSLLSNGAVATIAATRVSWYNLAQTEFTGSPSNQGMIYSFVQNVIRDSMEVGPALNLIKSSIPIYSSEYWMNYLDYNVYGCPDEALRLKPSVIGAPTGLTATAVSSSQINLSWADRSSNESGFRIERAPYNGTFTVIATVGANVTTYQNTGLSTGQQYQFRVRAYTSSENSLYSNVVSSFTSGGQTITAPTGVAIQNMGSYNLLSWNTVSGATSYNTWVSSSSNGHYALAFSEQTGTSSYINMTPGQTFYFVVSAVTPNGESPYSAQVSAVSPAVIPTNLTIQDITTTTIGLNFEYWANLSQRDGVTIDMEYATTGAFTLYTQDLWFPANGTNYYQVSNLTPGTTYKFRIRAKRGTFYSAYSDIITATTTGQAPPAAPSNLIATQTGSSITISWTDNSSNEAGFIIERALPPSNFSPIPLATTGPNVTSYQDNSVSAGNLYAYRVMAYNSSANSDYSNIVSLTMGSTPTSLYRINCGSSSAQDPFTADQYATNGTLRTVSNTIDMSGVTNPAPQAVYQSERYGTCTYTIPNLTSGSQFRVRLHFAELYQTAAGKRKFNVVINGSTVLSNFDIYAAVGAQYKATVREFTATANSSGQIVINFNFVPSQHPIVIGSNYFILLDARDIVNKNFYHS